MVAKSRGRENGEKKRKSVAEIAFETEEDSALERGLQHKEQRRIVS